MARACPGSKLGLHLNGQPPYIEGMRRLARVLPFALLPLFSTAAPLPPASAVTIDVDISNFAFGPSSVTIGQGSSVRWTNVDGTTHSVESFQSFFSSPNLGNGAVFSANFPDAGSFRYFCRQHGSGMSGTIKVRMKKSGSSGAGWTVRWSNRATAPTDRDYDVLLKRPGATSFTSFRDNTSARSAFFNPSRNGTYTFKARTRNTSNGESSTYSPVLKLSIS